MLPSTYFFNQKETKMQQKKIRKYTKKIFWEYKIPTDSDKLDKALDRLWEDIQKLKKERGKTQ